MYFYGTSHIRSSSELSELKTQMKSRVDRSGENFPKSILTMFYGWENASGSAFKKAKNQKKIDPAIVRWH